MYLLGDSKWVEILSELAFLGTPSPPVTLTQYPLFHLPSAWFTPFFPSVYNQERIMLECTKQGNSSMKFVLYNGELVIMTHNPDGRFLCKMFFSGPRTCFRVFTVIVSK